MLFREYSKYMVLDIHFRSVKYTVVTSLRKNSEQHFFPIQVAQCDKCVAECVHLCPQE